MTQDWSALLRLTPDDHGPWVVIVGSGLLLGLASMMALSTLPLKWILALLAGLIGLCGLIVVGETRKILLAAILLDNPLQMDVSWGYDFIAGGRGAIAGFNVSVTTIARRYLLIIYLAIEHKLFTIENFIWPGRNQMWIF